MSLNLPLGQYVVFGSGLLAIHGIRETKDIDLFVTNELYNQLKGQGWETVRYSNGDGEHLVKEGVFEAYNIWHFGTYNPTPEEIIVKAEIHDGVPFAPLAEVLKWKQAFGRPKDLSDIELISKYMSKD